MSVIEHKKNSRVVSCMIITVSDSRTLYTDKSGQLMEQLLIDANHKIAGRNVVHDDIASIRNAVVSATLMSDVDAVLINGGTGMAGRDVTIEAVEPMLEKEMPGFGEIFRMLSYQKDIGSAAILSRAIAGIRGFTPIFAVPGSSGAVKLAMNELIIPELTHIVNEATKDHKA
ncbi:Molybdopterin adenylyltransferase [Lentibacillus sp. JNUCC-1]|uniref:MogA/MoaB family molybdenum cofactor biosynthesis protein n=1 Tax=Lentibacillus sp. JNUCC-1 TaxID=2654513 RepID=UPI0012E7A48F|nr:MogA/MoaB family molybdenum cofactor biosynthesis protein [Lentibacillus sp. JNUCC-1]MUV39320.1 Molybdopterin adenylyltransferase [Lentibacillus sp. JNUCC-1]